MEKKNKPNNEEIGYLLYDANFITNKWPFCYANNVILFPWDGIGDFRRFKSQDEVGKTLRKVLNRPDNLFYGESLAVWNFLTNMKKGDIVFAKNGNNKIVARGTVTGDYEFIDNKETNFKNRRSVEWNVVGEWEVNLPSYDNILYSINQIPDLITNINRNIKKTLSKTFRRFWLAVIDSKVVNIEDNNVTLPIYSNKIHNGDLVILYDWAKKEISGYIDVTNKDYNKKSISGNRHDYKIDIESIYNEGRIDGELIVFLKNPTEKIIELNAQQFDLFRIMFSDGMTSKRFQSYTTDDFLNDVFISETELNKLISLIKRKKNIILQGPPGVGKTFSAKRLAYTIMGEKDDARVEFVQFHQSYTYEDFIMGYKPQENGSFVLNRGVFYEFCKKAESNPLQSYFFIIDEINRGNLSKIFGELLQLIEVDYRDNKIKLVYEKNKSFSVPSNIYIIGMMNTADRSLAMIDYALRRRFCFFDMRPGFDTKGFINYKKQKKSKYFNNLVDAVKTVNEIILKDDSLGKGFLIGHSYLMADSGYDFDRETAESIIECELVPLVEEYWFDNDAKAVNAARILRNSLSDDK